MLNLLIIPLLLLLMVLLNWDRRLRLIEVRVLPIQLTSLLEVLILLCNLGNVSSCLVSTWCCSLISLMLLLLLRLLSTLLRHLYSNFFNLIGH